MMVSPPIASNAVVHTDPAGIHATLLRLDEPCYVVSTARGIGLSTEEPGAGTRVVTALGPMPARCLGSAAFRSAYQLRGAYVAGGMAGGVASAELVTALAGAGYLGVFGSGGVRPEVVQEAVRRVEADVRGRSFGVNLLHSPQEPALEREMVDLCLRDRVRCVEASAFLTLTRNIVRYRVAGLIRENGAVRALNRVIAKVSRPEVARQFMLPPPESLVAELREAGSVTAEQAECAREVAMADDVTVEADSGGHTDRRPLSALFPVIAGTCSQVRAENPAVPPVRLGAAGGLGTPSAIASAFTLGADYVLTGSINQSCAESGTSDRTRRMLAGAGIADFDMAPSPDMFEMGAQVQVLKKGTMFAARAQRLRQLYDNYPSLEDLPEAERAWLCDKVLLCSVERTWEEVRRFFAERDPAQLERADEDPRRRMALVFRWYLGLSSRWARAGDPERVGDYQVWSGPAMGSFNDWAAGSHLDAPEGRGVADVADQLMRGAAFTIRVRQLQLAGVRLPPAATVYRPIPEPDPGVAG